MLDVDTLEGEKGGVIQFFEIKLNERGACSARPFFKAFNLLIFWIPKAFEIKSYAFQASWYFFSLLLTIQGLIPWIPPWCLIEEDW